MSKTKVIWADGDATMAAEVEIILARMAEVKFIIPASMDEATAEVVMAGRGDVVVAGFYGDAMEHGVLALNAKLSGATIISAAKWLRASKIAPPDARISGLSAQEAADAIMAVINKN